MVIDNTSQFRMDDDVPLVVPEVNSHRIADGLGGNIIANPNCSTIQMVVALKPIYDAVGIERINVATYQAVSGAGMAGVTELAGQTANLLNAKPLEDFTAHPAQIAFNAVAHAWAIGDNGYSVEEMKMVRETKKIFEDDYILVKPHLRAHPGVLRPLGSRAYRNPRAALGVGCLRAAAPSGRRGADRRRRGWRRLSHAGGSRGGQRCGLRWPSGARTSPMSAGLNLWVVADNVRKGAALNSVQIAEQVRELI